jgi:sugar transferase EpsL
MHYPHIKRRFDICVAAAALLCLAPLLLLIALLVRSRLGSPVLFRQRRPGLHGRPFLMLKFRTMTNVCDAAGNPLPDEQRLTAFGRFLRATSLDELPELINVLRGEMSLVGPRPPLLYEVDLYQDWHKRRFEVPPGITGIWQVSGRNRVSFDEMVRMDLEYIENQSLWLDIKLLLKTPRAVIGAHGAG